MNMKEIILKNPIDEGWYADPEARIYEGQYVIYATRSLPFDEQKNQVCFTSADLVHWERLPDALCVDKKYGGGPALYWINGFYYVTFVDLFIHPLERRLAFRTLLTRSRDLIHWEEAPEERPVLLPDFSSRPDPEGYPDIYDVNASDAEFIQEEDKVRVYYISGNQWGVSDNRTALFTGSLQELFESRFS
jgi:alpha-L-fucosidase